MTSLENVGVYLPYSLEPYQPFAKNLQTLTRQDFLVMESALKRIHRFNGNSEMTVFNHSIFVAHLPQYLVEPSLYACSFLNQAMFEHHKKVQELTEAYTKLNKYQKELLRLCLLVHDFSEALIGDMVRPIKDTMSEYNDGSNRLDNFIIKSMICDPLIMMSLESTEKFDKLNSFKLFDFVTDVYLECKTRVDSIEDDKAGLTILGVRLNSDSYNINSDVMHLLTEFDSLASALEFSCLKQLEQCNLKDITNTFVAWPWVYAWLYATLKCLSEDDYVSIQIGLVNHIEKALKQMFLNISFE